MLKPETVGVAVALMDAVGRYCADDPNVAFLKLRQFGELVAQDIAEGHDVDAAMLEGQMELIAELAGRGAIDRQTTAALHRIRQDGNRAAHEQYADPVSCQQRIADAAEVARRVGIELDDSSSVSGPVAPTAQLEPPEEPPDASLEEENGPAASTPPAQSTPSLPRESGALVEEEPVPIAPRPWEEPPSGSVELEEVDPDSLRGLFVRGRRAAAALGALTEPLDQAWDEASALLAAASEPFRLGVVGEFRAGKSTLINALLGHDSALVDATETTATLNAYGQALAEGATIHFRDGAEELFASHDDLNDVLSARRDDTGWLETVEHVEFGHPAYAVGDLELWDGPGLGGNAANEDLANRFLDRITAAVWVLDAELLGNAGILEPLKRLQDAGKSVLVVINRVDALDEEQIEEAVEFVRETYESFAATVSPFSALEAVEARRAGRSDQRAASQFCLA